MYMMHAFWDESPIIEIRQTRRKGGSIWGHREASRWAWTSRSCRAVSDSAETWWERNYYGNVDLFGYIEDW